MRRTGLVVVMVVAGALMLTPVAGAAASWTQQDTFNWGISSKWNWSAVSCPYVSFCMAVGSQTGTTTGPIAEARTGGIWHPKTPPIISGGSNQALDAISCVSASDCWGVGSYMNGPNTVVLGQFYNGTGWTTATLPNPAGVTAAQLLGVSCTSASACVAVGTDSNGAFSEIWNGTSWSLPAGANPAGSGSGLEGVSCVNASDCVAVGSDASGVLAELWDGTAWTIQTTPNPSGKSPAFTSVSCTNASNCTAVGFNFAERWNGTVWTLQSVPHAANDTGGGPTLESVSCPTLNYCAAVGGYYEDAVLTHVIEAWNGTAWHVQNAPLDTSSESSALNGVSCNDINDCTAAGFYLDPTTGDRALAEVQALRWTIQPTAAPDGSTSSVLVSVSCRTALTCMTVGLSVQSPTVTDSIAESWDGSLWSLDPPASPTTTTLDGVSCIGANACTAVGSQLSGSSDLSLAEVTNPTGWTIQPTPNPGGAGGAILYSDSCISTSFCAAVGDYSGPSGAQAPLAELWNGTSWALSPVPAPASGVRQQLNGVSCTSTSSCVAVGDDELGNSFAIFTEIWNGTTWTLMSAPLPAGASSGALNGVSCTSSTACIAVGFYTVGSTTAPLVEKWSGTVWTASTAAVPSGGGSGHPSLFNGISCSTASTCMAVGQLDGAAGVTPISERYNGKIWGLVPVPLPQGSTTGGLESVSCTSPVVCGAVGSYNANGTTTTQLAERYS